MKVTPWCGHVSVGLTHQRRRHVTRTVLDIEAAGDLDLLHVFTGRHRDPGELLDRLVFLGRRLDEVDPDRVFRQRGKIDGDGFFQREVGGDENREHLRQLPEHAGLLVCKRDDCRISSSEGLWRRIGISMASIRPI
jgi:hypothetical protein